MSENNNKSGFVWLTDPKDIESKVAQWREGPCIAIDTEFVRENTYFAKAGLIQFADHEGVYLIDPLEVSDLRILAPLLSDSRCVKIMHSMSEDIELLFYLTGAIPATIFDTQVAAAFLGLGPSLGYQNLVQKVLGHELDKTETRSDWCQRPLSDRQLSYAAKDAEYLVELYDVLSQSLEAKQLTPAVLDECALLVKQSYESWIDERYAYLKLRGGWDLSESRQRLLQLLVAWRDKKAKEKNIPKPWVFNDAQLIDVCRFKIDEVRDLKRLDRIKPKSIRLYGQELIEHIQDYPNNLVQESDFKKIEKPIKGTELDIYRKLKKIVQKVSDKTDIAPQLLGSRKMLENIVIHVIRNGSQKLPEEYLGWRYAYLGDALMKALSESR